MRAKDNSSSAPVSGFDGIDVEFGRQARQVDQDVPDFLCQMPARPGIQPIAFVLGQPLKDFYQLGHFNAEGHGEILGGVKLIPVPL